MTGVPLSYNITFPSSFANPYVVNIDCDVPRTFTVYNKLSTGFSITSNSITPFSDAIYWEADDLTSGSLGIVQGATGPQGPGIGSQGFQGSIGNQGPGIGSQGFQGQAFSSPYTGNLGITAGQAWVNLSLNGGSTVSNTVNWNNSNIQSYTLNANTSFTFSNGLAGATYILLISQNAANIYNVTWPVSVAWSGGATPSITATYSKTDIFTFIYNGTTYYGGYSQNY